MELLPEDLPRATGPDAAAAIKAFDAAEVAGPKDYLVSDVARILDVSPSFVRKKLDEWKLPYHRLPGSAHRRIRRADLARWLESRPDLSYAIAKIL